jgi:thioredoxin reductase (NADPH)
VIAVGLTYRRLEVPGANELTGAGVYYGASLTEVISCEDQPAFVIGAGNSAGQSAMYLVEYASRVVMVVRGERLEDKMSQYLVDRILQHPRIEVHVQSEITSVHGSDHVESVTLRNNETGEEQLRPAAAVFIFIGAIPCTDWLRGVVELDEYGFVLAGPDLVHGGRPPNAYWPLDRDPYLLESSVPGVFVVGDVRANSVKRVASAVGEGSISVQLIHRYLAKVK